MIPKDKKNTRILHSGSKAKDKVDSRDHALYRPCVYVSSRRLSTMAVTSRPVPGLGEEVSRLCSCLSQTAHITGLVASLALMMRFRWES